MNSEARVVFASTAYGPLWAPAVNSWLTALAYTARYLHVENSGMLLGSGVTDRQYTHSAENTLVENFLDDKLCSGATHLFFTEMDMILPRDAIVKLLEMDVDIATGVYFLRGGDGQPCLYKKILTTRDNPWVHTPVSIFPTQEPFRVDCPGLGCVLFKRKVFETLKYPWFDLAEGKYGSDMYFYTNAKTAGLEVWANPKVMCGQIDYTVVEFDDYVNRVKNDPKFAASGYIIAPKAVIDA